MAFFPTVDETRANPPPPPLEGVPVREMPGTRSCPRWPASCGGPPPIVVLVRPRVDVGDPEPRSVVVWPVVAVLTLLVPPMLGVGLPIDNIGGWAMENPSGKFGGEPFR